MKKLISLLMILTVVLTALVGCGDKAPVEKDYSLSIGVVVTEDLAKNKITQTAATVVTDAEGKIVLCRLDCVDFTAKYGDDGALITTAPTSKASLGDYYMMDAGSWASQGKALEGYVVGKTQAEVAAIALDGGKLTDTDLKASCSIDVSDMLKAIDNAFKNQQKTAFKTASTALTAGMNLSSAVKDSSKDDSKNVKLTTDYASVVLADGVVVAAILDTAEPELKGITDETGAASLSFAGTKRAQGDSYGIMPAGTWFAQADAYAKSAVGKTASDIATIASEGVAGCTIYAGGYKAGIEAAVALAR